MSGHVLGTQFCDARGVRGRNRRKEQIVSLWNAADKKNAFCEEGSSPQENMAPAIGGEGHEPEGGVAGARDAGDGEKA